MLKLGRCYKITKVRDKRHVCNVHEGTAVVVEVQELPVLTTIDKKLSEGSSTKIEKKDCNSIGCIHYDLCNSSAVQKDKTYNIKKIFEPIECPLGYELQKAELN